MPYDSDQDNPYTVPKSDLTVSTGPFVEWNDTAVRNATAIVCRVLTCAWATYFTFVIAHMSTYWLLKDNIRLILIDLPWVVLCAALAIPIVVFLPSRIIVQICRRKIGVSGFLNKWDKNVKDILGRPLTASFSWVGMIAALSMVWQGLKVIWLDIGPSNITWFLAMVIALSLAFVISLPICRIACLGIEKRLDKMEEATQLHSEL